MRVETLNQQTEAQIGKTGFNWTHCFIDRTISRKPRSLIVAQIRVLVAVYLSAAFMRDPGDPVFAGYAYLAFSASVSGHVAFFGTLHPFPA